MAGGLLNLVAYGSQNVILNGNPSKTFFKCTYVKYTNFGLQKFRVDFDGQKTLRLTDPSTFEFKFPRYADLLMDTYLVLTLPTIWSPIYPPQCNPDGSIANGWSPYEFKWIDNLGTQLIQEISVSVGGQLIQRFSGQYLYNLIKRDFNGTKKHLYSKMTGNVPELNNPANFNGGKYPNAWPGVEGGAGPEPSIRARRLYIPINIWFTLASKMAFPLVSLQYNELRMEVTIRPIIDLFVIRDVLSGPTCNPNNPNSQIIPNYIQASQSVGAYSFNRFLHPPPGTQDNPGDISVSTSYPDKRTDWAADVHLMSTYCFLSDDEIRVFASQPQNYLVKQIYEYSFPNVTGNQRVSLDSLGLIACWMWFFQRSDAYLRNEWSNYSNWPYNHVKPEPVRPTYPDLSASFVTPISCSTDLDISFNPAQLDISCPPCPVCPFTDISNGTNLFYTGEYSVENQKDIMLSFGILLDGAYRENVLDAGVYNYIEKYVRTSGDGQDGLYCYNFCLHTNPFNFQPSGAINISKFKNVQFEFSTYQPPLDPSAQTFIICEPKNDLTDLRFGMEAPAVAINKPMWRIYDYNYNLYVMEERINILSFISGTAGLAYAR